MATKGASPDQILDAEKPTGEQPFAVDISPEHHGHSMGKSEDTNSSKSKKDNNSEPGGKKKQGAGIGDYFVSPLEAELRNTDSGPFAARLSIYRHPRPMLVRDRHLRCSGHWRYIAVDDPGLRVIYRFDRRLFFWTRRPARIRKQNSYLGPLVRVLIRWPLRHRLFRNTGHGHCSC